MASSRHRITLIAMLPVLLVGTVARAAPGDVPARVLPLHDFLVQFDQRLISAREIDLRQTEAIERINHIRRSRAWELNLAGSYEEDDFDRVETNGDNVKMGRLREYRREAEASINYLLLGVRLEDRFIVALEEQRLAELEFEELVAQKRAVLSVVDLYLELFEVQESITLLEGAVGLEQERVRIYSLRHAGGEALRRDVLSAEADVARRQLALVQAQRRQWAIFGDLGREITGSPPEPFRAVALDWDALEGRVTGAEGAADTGDEAGIAVEEDEGLGSFWYNVPEIDLTVGYRVHSLDRNFADESRRERGHSPEFRVSLEVPLDFYRSVRAFQKQSEARYERRRLSLMAQQRRWQALRDDVELAIAEAQAVLQLARTEDALYREDLRVTRLRVAAGEVDDDRPADVSLIEAELDTVESEIRLMRARSNLARSVFERELTAGRDPRLLATKMASGALASTSEIDSAGRSATRGPQSP